MIKEVDEVKRGVQDLQSVVTCLKEACDGQPIDNVLSDMEKVAEIINPNFLRKMTVDYTSVLNALISKIENKIREKKGEDVGRKLHEVELLAENVLNDMKSVARILLQRVIKSDLQPHVLAALMNAVCGLEGIAISDWTVAVVIALVQKDEKEAMNVGNLLRLLGLFSEQNARLTQVQVLNLFRTVVKKYGKQLASQKGYLQSLLEGFDQKNALVKLLQKMIEKL
ncbi:hypothetical protein AV274_3534 [Blastocystis sp. ATCC 50177/Nand II]|uniref:Uncharacterized protein n=1 Tax=Blastocystis sp. subtype 1 (strain ATCC 50177 / NandII) TaxID=478820 RepID=A0A196SCQ4_BLAHN|nr:hypothetical protein AV274_3534 [Blastocystis sp. ATCC 50177/Nand II]